MIENYIDHIDSLAQNFVHLVAECLSLPADTLDDFKGNSSPLKFVKYPASAPDSQGVGPHKDSAGLFTFLSQDDTGGLQVLNKNGNWIDVPPIEGSLVVNIQQGFEAITGGVCAATTHRVIVCMLEDFSCLFRHTHLGIFVGTDFQDSIQYSLFPRRAIRLDACTTGEISKTYCSAYSGVG